MNQTKKRYVLELDEETFHALQHLISVYEAIEANEDSRYEIIERRDGYNIYRRTVETDEMEMEAFRDLRHFLEKFVTPFKKDMKRRQNDSGWIHGDTENE